MTSSKNLFYSDLSEMQILIEIIKRYVALDYKKEWSMPDLFANAWFLMDEKCRELAEEWFVVGINKGYIKGVFYKYQKSSGTNLYIRIPNDVYNK